MAKKKTEKKPLGPLVGAAGAVWKCNKCGQPYVLDRPRETPTGIMYRGKCSNGHERAIFERHAKPDPQSNRRFQA